ncbi:AT-rich interactive domain-containing protein 5B [Triplophysa tibetana]|uniref:AT-rich interactive domain-containing protein 5B n=1 Tax=Triplophysa tibetana TaxID=1572043 RepID=A0A5A9PVQ5_9TELE|nr:AT-rich interactive domain-containing protein 5B [Triplophysa tibetana]
MLVAKQFLDPIGPERFGTTRQVQGVFKFCHVVIFEGDGNTMNCCQGMFFFLNCQFEQAVCGKRVSLHEKRKRTCLVMTARNYFLFVDSLQFITISHCISRVINKHRSVFIRLHSLAMWRIRPGACISNCLRKWYLRPEELLQPNANGAIEGPERYLEEYVLTGNECINVNDFLLCSGDDVEEKRVLVLSYPQYCRYRSVIARLRERPTSLLTDHVVLALGGIASLTNNTQILYCRDTFDHPTLVENDSVCDEFAPNLKGRPRKKRLSICQRRDSQGHREHSSALENKSPVKVKVDSKAGVWKPRSAGSSCKRVTGEGKQRMETPEECHTDEQAFLVALYKYMKERKTPIERIPYLGFKQINLWTMFQAAQKLGGYEVITARRQWKNVYDELGGNPGSTSAATCTRRHYERLILPYERFTKGEEDRPLPPSKSRKQETGAPEVSIKTKLTAIKRPKDEQKCGTENEVSGNVAELLLSGHRFPFSALPSGLGMNCILRREKGQEDKEELQEVLEKLESLQGPVKKESESESLLSEDEAVQLEVKDEEQKPVLHSTYEPANGIVLSSLPLDGVPLKSEVCDVFPVSATAMPLHHANPLPNSHTADQWQHGLVEYKVPPGVLGKVEPKDSNNQVGTVLPTLKLKPLATPKIPPERIEVPRKEEACFSYNPLLYPRGNPGIMSPLAKKKMLSQVSGTGLLNNYPYGPPPPLVSRTLSSSGTEESVTGQQSSQTPSTIEPNMVIKRPSVIQHAQSFKSRAGEDRRCSTESSQKEGCGEGEPLAQSQPTHIREPYLPRADTHCSVEISAEMPHPGQAPSFLSDFYSSPHLHDLCRQTEHHLNKEQISKYLNRDAYPRDCETAQGFPPNQHPESMGLTYCARLNQKDKGPAEERIKEEQPTDLSLPKPSPHKPSLSTFLHPTMQQDIKNSSLYQGGTGQSSSVDYHPRACRVPPMTVSLHKKLIESHPRVLEKIHNGRAEDTLGYKMDEMTRPILGTKSCPQNICTTRPLKRNLEELENGAREKKIRAVTPLHCSTQRDGPGKARTPDADGESTKPAEAAHAVHSYTTEGHKFPLHSHLFQGLYPGAFVSQVQDMCESLGSHVTPSYSHPLQYLKNQAVLSPLMPPFAIHSLMMQRQFLPPSPAHISVLRHTGDFVSYCSLPRLKYQRSPLPPAQYSSLQLCGCL